MKLENKALVLDLIEWVAAQPRTYSETIDAWRTSCPRLPVWEDAVDHGFVARVHTNGATLVGVTDAGRHFLNTHRPKLTPTPTR